ncbi:ATP-binding protein [Macrococcus equipercicus]|uniref:histidine kinase n=1 Tax=Macrococcus equipercicus TaxID=69967 RepID=A0A9Q9BRQ1_9STAP|nr:ATP-binding protein [Macrococcus equipercicus]KAA1042614.1 GHKL domain-containing protein [Macrococcus equipercicus]UTH14476.1 GHKL domain-containing protein [Macrococcus equipercicus]
MKQLKKHLILNLLITLILSSAIFYALFHYYKGQDLIKIDRNIAMHQQHIETFINDAYATVANLATVVSLSRDEDEINSAIDSIKRQEPRYKTVYVLNKESKVVNSSSSQMIGKTLKSYAFFNSNMNLNNVAVSGREQDRNGIDVIYISKFIPNESSKVLVVIEVDINGLISVIDAIQSKSTITITDFHNKVIFESKNPVKSGISRTVSFQNMQWKLTITSNENIYWTTLKRIVPIAFIISLVTAMLQLFMHHREIQKERLRLIEEINVQKKELIGMLAANTAHEIKNPLTAVKGFVELLELSYDKERSNPHFSIVKSELDRINEIVSQFLLLGRPTSIIGEPVEITTVVKDILIFLKYELEHYNIRLISSYPEQPLYTTISSDQLKQILINLIQNAREAIPPDRQGIIEVKVSQQEHIFLSVRDNGEGMTKQTINQLFDTFFTTKANGTGLGLPVTKNIIETNGGTISVESEVHIGTTFIIQLPNKKD